MRFRSFTLALAGVLSLVSIASAKGVKLKAVRFPTSADGVSGTTTAPTSAPLSQAIVFEFSGKPKIGNGISEGLRIRVSGTNSGGQQTGEMAFGTYKVEGKRVVFTPRLPTGELTSSFSATSDVASDISLPGFRPNTTYDITVTIGGANSVKNLKGIAGSVVLPMSFTTTAIPATYFSNMPDEPVKVKKQKKGKKKVPMITPKPGVSGVDPNPFSDPAGIFSGIPANRKPPFSVTFNGALDTSSANLAGGRLRLRAIITPEGVVEDRILGSTVALTMNKLSKSNLLLYPSGALPLGHTVALELSTKLQALSGAQKDPSGAEAFEELARYQVALDPNPGTAVDDYIYEDFDTATHQDTSIAASGDQLAGWDSADSNALRASFGFGGDGSLGAFSPPPNETVTIYLDTNYQPFPLFSGATPEAAPGTIVVGGVFNFTSFTLPRQCTLIIRGNNPAIITCTGEVTIEGVIDLNGSDGSSDDTFDSAITPMPGGAPGPGGGRGGDSHPVYVPSGAQSLTYIQTPQWGESGYAPGNVLPGGGGGGQCGCTLPWSSFNGGTCSSYGGTGDGSRGPGGGGGSFNVFFPVAPEPSNILVSGRRGGIGVGNHLPVTFSPGDPIPPEPWSYRAELGTSQTENAVAMSNPNMTFAEAHAAGLIYDKGSQFQTNLNWPQTKKILMFGNAGPLPFQDSDDSNNYIGPGGELSSIIGGQGGGGAGSRTEGLDQECKSIIFDNAGFPFTVLDSRGGGAGAGAGAMMIQALGIIEIKGTSASIQCRGGNGGGGEGVSGSGRGGSGGGGSGGAIILQSASNVYMNDIDLQARVIDVKGGCGANASQLTSNANTGCAPGGDSGCLQFADGGPGGPGIVQVHIPEGATPSVDASRISARVYKSVFTVGTTAYLGCGETSVGDFPGTTEMTALVDMNKTPTPLTPRSVARSTWYDLGAITSDYRPPVVTSAGALQGPVFGVPGMGPFFKGTSAASGEVLTSAAGFVVDPFLNDIEVDSPDLITPDYIPNGSGAPFDQTVTVLFEGADEDAAFPGSPDPTTSTGFVSDVTLLNGKRFIRWEIHFNIASNPSNPPIPNTPRPQVNMLRLPFKY